MPLQPEDPFWWVHNKGAMTNDIQDDTFMKKPSQASPHSMSLPSGSPWNAQSVSWGMPTPQPPLVEFTGKHNMNMNDQPSLHCKRKSNLQVNIPRKQFITDEKMAAHLNGLHISADYKTHSPVEIDPEPGTSQGHNRLIFSDSDIAERLKSAQKVVLCDEMKNLTKESLLPSTILQRMNEQRCMSLVLWKPPEKCLSSIVEDDEDNNNKAGTRNSLPENSQAMDVEM